MEQKPYFIGVSNLERGEAEVFMRGKSQLNTLKSLKKKNCKQKNQYSFNVAASKEFSKIY